MILLPLFQIDIQKTTTSQSIVIMQTVFTNNTFVGSNAQFDIIIIRAWKIILKLNLILSQNLLKYFIKFIKSQFAII